MNVIKKTCISLLFLASCSCYGTSYLAESKPKIQAIEAINLAIQFLEKEKAKTEESYLVEAKLGYFDSNDRKWKIVFSKTTQEYFFIIVDMQGTASVAPKPKNKELKLKPSKPQSESISSIPWSRPVEWENVEIQPVEDGK